MAALPTILETIDYADLAIGLCANDNARGALYGKRLTAPSSPVTQAIVTDALRWLYAGFPEVAGVSAIGYITVTDIGDDGDEIEVFCDIPEVGVVSLGSYEKDSGDTDTTILAASIAAELSYTGFTFASNLAVISITAPAIFGAEMNIGNRLSVEITPNEFVPTDIADLWSWYESGVGVTGTTSVTQWNDQSGNGRNLLSAVAPKLTLNVINGYPVIEPNSAGSRMLPAANFPVGDYTIFIVGSQSVGSGALDDGDGVFLYSAANDMIISRDGTNDAISGALSGLTKAATNGTFYTIRNKYLTTGSNGYYLALNNGSEGFLSASGSASPDQLLVFDDGFSNYGNKKIAEILIYTRALAAPEVTQVETYLQTKYQHY